MSNENPVEGTRCFEWFRNRDIPGTRPQFRGVKSGSDRVKLPNDTPDRDPAVDEARERNDSGPWLLEP